ncbi:MAG TPA: ATPase domain-containing protein [Candidatus Norongarragalinales archaeon]|nr:ATPase domain-containing protein [Candidatus Norongarragalinales archaeon]
MADLDARLKRELKSLPQHYIVMLVTDSSEYMEANLASLRFLMEPDDAAGIYVTFNRPYESLTQVLKKEKLDVGRLYFLDLITQTSGKRGERTENCIFLPSPKNLTELSIALTQLVERMEQKNRFIFMDSLSTMLIYNSAGTVAQFTHFLVSKMRLWKVGMILVSLEKETDKKLIDDLSQFCDKVITIGKK